MTLPHGIRVLLGASLCLFFGCNTATMSHHYVKSVEAKGAGVPLTPSIANPAANGSSVIGLRAGYRDRETSRLQTLGVDREGRRYYPEPGHYSLKNGQVTLGADYRFNPVEHIDFFVSTGWNLSVKRAYGSMLNGLGITLPLSWANLRIAPALGFIAYRSQTHDSVISSGEDTNIWGTESTPWVDTTVRSTEWVLPHLGGVFSVSVSAWLPQKWKPGAWNPFVQTQYNAIRMSSPNLPADAFSVRELVLAAGTTYDIGKTGTWNLKLLRSGLYNKSAGSVSYRLESGIEFPLRERR